MVVRRLGHLTKSSSKQQRLWEEEQKATALVIAEEDRNRYSPLTAALELRFRNGHLKKVFAAQVKTRIQKAGESLQEFEADVKRLVRLEYSDAPPSFQETFATETFVNGIRDTATVKLIRSYKYQRIRHPLMS